MVDLGLVTSVITGIAVIVGLALAVLQLRDLKRVREAEVAVQAQQNLQVP